MSRGWIKHTDAFSEITRNEQLELQGDLENLRRHGRVKPGGVWCSHGKVLDLSASGVRLLSKRSMSDEDVIRLQGSVDGFTVRARVVWVRKLGFRRYEIGLHFLDLPPDAGVRIRRIAAV